tara:strand:+ start:164 stop:508 length:345 start_codon:yes stop_codon:yes gene_type:complete
MDKGYLKNCLSYYYAAHHNEIKLGTPYSFAAFNQPPITFLDASEVQVYQYTFQFIKTVLVQIGGSRFLVQVNLETIQDLEWHVPRQMLSKVLPPLKPCRELLLEHSSCKVKHLV